MFDMNSGRPMNTGANGLQDAALLYAVLNQVDYGLAVVDVDTCQLVYANAHALAALQAPDNQMAGLHISIGMLCARRPSNAAQLAQALNRTRAGVRCLLNLVYEGRETSVAVMPLSIAPQPVDHCRDPVATRHRALLAFAKPQLCDTTTITLFARERGLTGAEGQVLAQICRGMRPHEIATRHGVQVSTVRTQLRAIRQKTASESVRALIAKVSVLPPLAWQMPNLNWPGFAGGTLVQEAPAG